MTEREHKQRGFGVQVVCQNANIISETFACFGKYFRFFLLLHLVVGKCGDVIFDSDSTIREIFEGDNFIDQLIEVADVLLVETVLQVGPNVDSEISVWYCQKDPSVNAVHEDV